MQVKHQGSVGGEGSVSLVKVCVWFRQCVLVFNLRMRVCSSITLSVLLEKSPFTITYSRSQIEWSGLLKCLATGSHLMLSRILFIYCSYGV